MINYSELASYKTSVSSGKTLDGIDKIMKKAKINEFRVWESKAEKKLFCEFIKTIQKDGKSINQAFRIVLELPTEEPLRRQTYRLLFYLLKYKLERVNAGLTSLEKEFFADLLITDKGGKTATLYELMIGGYQKYLTTGAPFSFLPGERALMAPKEE